MATTGFKIDAELGSILKKYQSKELTLLCPSTDNTRIRDFLIMSLYSNQNVATMKFKPYLLFLDGEYWGFYYLTEKYNNDFISYYYKIKNRRNIIMAKGGDEDKNFIKFENIYNFCYYNDFGIQQNYDIPLILQYQSCDSTRVLLQTDHSLFQYQ